VISGAIRISQQQCERVAYKARDSIESRNSTTWLLLVEKGAFCFWTKMDISQSGQQ
jgi:hypothetical protein